MQAKRHGLLFFLATFGGFLYGGDPRMNLTAFLDRVYAGCTAGYLTIWTLPDKHTEYFEISKVHDAVAYVQTRVDSHNVFFGVGLRREARGPYERGTKRNVLSLPGIWLDVDVKGNTHAQETLPATWADAMQVINLCPLPPSILVSTGGGLHAYWLFNQPLEVEEGKHENVNTTFKKFQNRIRKEAEDKFGYKIDPTGDITRVLRLPETYNYKGESRRPAEVIFEDPDARYSIAEIFSFNKLPLPPTPVRNESAITEARKRLKKLARIEHRELMAKVLVGEAFAEIGERDTTLQKAAGCAAFVFSPEDAEKLDAAALAPLFEKSIAVMAEGHTDSANPPLTMEDVIDKLSRALSDRAREAEKNREIWAGVDRGNVVGSSTNTENTEESAGIKKPVFRYTPDQIAKFASDNGVTPAQFNKRWIIQHASTYYIFSDGKYKSPVDRESVIAHVFRELSGIPSISLETFSQGSIRPKTRQEIVRDYGDAAIHLRGSFYEKKSKYTLETNTFCEALCVPRDITPRYYPEIHKWLVLLGGPQADKLLDWIATVTLLTWQSSALYLSGAAGSGKTMLATGLSRIWHMGGPTRLENITGAFNADLFHCPLVFGDESVSCSTTDLRELVGSNSRTLKRKFLSNTFVDGALRIILADNSGRLLRDHDLAGSDVEAVASKFLNIKVTQEPTDYLRSIGGRSGTAGWVDGEKIAAHALWLADPQNRKVVPGNRLIVEGDGPSLAQALVVQGSATGVLCEWIAKYINSPQPAISQEGGVVLGHGEIWVSAEVLEKHWDTYVEMQSRKFTVTKIGRALSHISLTRAQMTIKVHGKSVNRRMTSVNKDYIYSWAETNLSCDMDEFRAKVES